MFAQICHTSLSDESVRIERKYQKQLQRLSLCLVFVFDESRHLLALPRKMRSRVYATVRCPSICMSVRLCVCPIRRLHATAAGLLLWAGWAGTIDRLLPQRRANAGSATLSAYVGS